MFPHFQYTFKVLNRMEVEFRRIQLALRYNPRIASLTDSRPNPSFDGRLKGPAETELRRARGLRSVHRMVHRPADSPPTKCENDCGQEAVSEEERTTFRDFPFKTDSN